MAHSASLLDILLPLLHRDDANGVIGIPGLAMEKDLQSNKNSHFVCASIFPIFAGWYLRNHTSSRDFARGKEADVDLSLSLSAFLLFWNILVSHKKWPFLLATRHFLHAIFFPDTVSLYVIIQIIWCVSFKSFGFNKNISFSKRKVP